MLGAEPFAPVEPDDRLRLIFTCCHPALSREAQLALTLRAVCGFTTTQIAHAFVVSEAAVAQRLARARRKIVTAGIPYRVPEPDELDERLTQVLAVLYLMFNEGYLASGDGPPTRRDLTAEAAALTGLLGTLYPRHAETLGLHALIRLHLARAGSRFTAENDLVLLPDQDRGRWDRPMIVDALDLLARAGALHRPGPYQLQAAIVACHTEAETWPDTDWPQILALYDLLLAYSPSPVVRLNRAVAVHHVAGPATALGELDTLAAELDGYHLYHAVRGHVLVELGRREQARAAELRALALTANRAEQSLLRRRMNGSSR
jgi:RNA polymerase sigma-70 factor (ECF subfamily)